MRPEYRSQIDPKYAKKIEAIVRRAPKSDEPSSAASSLPCPVCQAELAVMETLCSQCRTTLPVCIATGEHVAADGLAACPECDFPCRRSAMETLLRMTPECPMCGESVEPERLVDVADVAPYVNAVA